jgi:hypothetical protein
LVKKTKGNRWIANIIVLDQEEKKPLVKIANQLSHEEALKIKNELSKLEAAYKKCSFESQGFFWEQTNYIILAALIADLGVNYSLHKKDMVPPPPKRSDGGRWYFWGLEGGSESKRTFGVNSNSNELGGVAHIWSPQVEKPTISPFESDEITIMLSLVSKSLEISEIAKVTKLSPEIVKQKMERLSAIGYFSETKGKFKPNFPIFTTKDVKIMVTEIIRTSDLIVDEIIKPKKETFQRLFKKLGLAETNHEYGAYLCMLYHMVMDHVLDKLVENNVLPEMPKKAPVTWGFWGWEGDLKLFTA